MSGTLLATTPPVGWLSVALGIYALVLVPMVLWGLGRAGRRGLGWVVLPVFSLVTSAGMWMYVHQLVST